jgi:hypothetical protein
MLGAPMDYSIPELPPLDLEALHAQTITVFREGGGSRPEVALVRFGEREAVLKDYAHSDPWFRRLIGPVSTRREAWALRRLDGVKGVPRLLARPERHALLMEYLPGRSVRQLRRTDSPPPEFFERLYELVAQIHARGLAHCDLRSRGNVLIGDDGLPYLVDFVAHFKRGQWWNPLTRWVYRKLCEADRTAVARLKRRFVPHLLTESENAALARDRNTPLERGSRVVGRTIRDLSRWLLTRR